MIWGYVRVSSQKQDHKKNVWEREAMLDRIVAETDCTLCRDLDPTQRAAMRSDLIVIPLGDTDHICDPCMEAFTANLFASFPKTEEERLRRRAEMRGSQSDPS
jgi:hypothetical protein